MLDVDLILLFRASQHRTEDEVGGTNLISAGSDAHLQLTLLLPRSPLVLVEVILLQTPAAEEDEVLILAQPRPLLDESSKRRDSRSWPDHDERWYHTVHWCGENEGAIDDAHGNSSAGLEARDPVGTYSRTRD